MTQANLTSSSLTRISDRDLKMSSEFNSKHKCLKKAKTYNTEREAVYMVFKVNIQEDKISYFIFLKQCWEQILHFKI